MNSVEKAINDVKVLKFLFDDYDLRTKLYEKYLRDTLDHYNSLSDYGKRLYTQYRLTCAKFGIGIANTIEEALIEDAHLVLYVKEASIYIITKSKEEYSSLSQRYADIYLAAGEDETGDTYGPTYVYQILYGDKPHTPIFVFGIGDNLEKIENKLCQHFKCSLHRYIADMKALYDVQQSFPTIGACMEGVNTFLVKNSDISPIREEMTREILYNDKNIRMHYCEVPIIRMASLEPIVIHYTINNITSNSGNVHIGDNNKIIKKTEGYYIPLDKIKEWVIANPPPNDMPREIYRNKCKEALGRIKSSTFSKVMLENYHCERLAGVRVWIANK